MLPESTNSLPISFELESRLKIGDNPEVVDALSSSALWIHNGTTKDDSRPKARSDVSTSESLLIVL